MKALRQLWISLATCALGAWSVPSQAQALNLPEDVAREIVRRHYQQEDPLPAELNARLEELGGFLNKLSAELQQGNAKSQGARSADDAFIQAGAAELRRLRERLEANVEASSDLGVGPTRDWAKLRGDVTERFQRIDALLGDIESATDDGSRSQAIATAAAEFQALSSGSSSAVAPLAERKPTWTTQAPQPFTPQPVAAEPPAYVTAGAPLRTLTTPSSLAASFAAPPAPPANACGSASQVASALGHSQEVPIDPAIDALAAQLEYSPARIYEYVYSHIGFDPYFGSLKGASGTLVAGRGSATDQASLLIALLRASNVPARYVRGTVLVADAAPDANGGRVARWLGARSYAGASGILGQGQNPAVVLQNNVSGQTYGISLAHVWVEACVPYHNYRGTGVDASGYRWIPLDASFKDQTYQAGIVTPLAFDYPGYLTHRTHVLPAEAFASQVLGAVRSPSSLPFGVNNTLADVPYTGTLRPLQLDVLPASLPYEVVNFTAWPGTASAEIDEVPDSHRYKVNVTFWDNLGTTLLQATQSLPEVNLARTTLSFEGASPADQAALQTWQRDGTLPNGSPSALPCTINVKPVLRGWVAGVEGSVVAAGAAAQAVNICSHNHQLNLSVTLAELTNPTVNSIQFSDLSAANYHAFQIYAHQTSAALLERRTDRLLDTVVATADPNTNLDETEGEFLHIAGLRYMQESAAGAKQIGELRNGSGDVGMQLGLTAAEMKVAYVFDVPYAVARNGFYIDFPGGISRNVNLSSGNIEWDTFLLGGYHASALEHAIWQESIRLDAVSTVRGLQFASEQGIPQLTLNAANWAAQVATIPTNPGCTVNATLNYPQCILDSFKTNYIDAGYTLRLPRSLIQYGNWKGYVFVGELDNTGTGFTSQAAYIIGRIAGGYTLRPLGDTAISGVPLTTYDAAADTGYVTPNPRAGYAATPPAGTAAQPLLVNPAGLDNGFDRLYSSLNHGVNVVTGNVVISERDVDIPGRGDASLLFHRTYNSRNAKSGPLGYGWTHNYDVSLVFKDDNANNVVDAGDTDGITSSIGWATDSGGEKLFTVTGTASGVAIGAAITRLPGTYATLVRNADGSYTVREKNGTAYTFASTAGTAGQRARLSFIADRNGNRLTLNYLPSCGSKLCSVTDDAGRSLTLSYDASNRITAVTDHTGRQFQYVYSDGRGNLNSVVNPLAALGQEAPETFEYYAATDGFYRDHALKRRVQPTGGATSYEYYAHGRLFRQIDPSGNHVSYRYNDFARQTIQTTERGFTRTYTFDQYGNTVRVVEPNDADHRFYFATNNPNTIYERIGVQSPEGLLTQYTLDAQGNVLAIQNPSGGALTLSNYNGFGQAEKLRDPNGNYTILKHDANGNLTEVIDLARSYCASQPCDTLNPATFTPSAAAPVRWEVRQYDARGNQTRFKQVRDFALQVAQPTATSNSGPILETVYDASGLFPTAVRRTGKFNHDTAPTTVSATLVYDSLGRLTQGIDSDWHPTSFTYDAVGRPLSGTDSLGHQRSYVYDGNGNVVLEQLVEGGKLLDSRAVDYDLQNRRTAFIDAGGAVTQFAYDEAGNLAQKTNPDGYIERLGYDPSNHPNTAYDALGRPSYRDLDDSGKPRSMTDANGNTTRFEYCDAACDGRLRAIIDAGDHRIQYGYDANGNAIASSLIGNDGTTTRTTNVFYDELNRPARVLGPVHTDAVLGTVRQVLRTQYDGIGNVTAIDAGYTTDLTGANANLDVLTPQSISVFDDFGHRIAESDALGRTWAYSYDSHGNLVDATDPLLQSTTYNWTTGHLLTSLVDDDGQTYGYDHNALGQVTRSTSPLVTYAFAYDEHHRLAQVVDSRANKALNYSYSPAGLLDRKVDSDGNRTDYLYDPTGRLTGLWSPKYEEVGFGYDASGRLQSRWASNGARAEYTYNPDNSLDGVFNYQGSTLLSSHQYSYDALGNRDALTEVVNGTGINYAFQYDALNRLTQVDTGVPSQLQSFQYDVWGNRTRQQVGATVRSYLHDAANQLTEIRAGSPTGALLASLTYDANGNLLSRSDKARTLTYDALNRLVQVAQTGVPTQSFGYDGAGRRIREISGSTTRNFVYDGMRLHGEYSGTWTAPVAYSYGTAGLDDVLLGESSGSSAYYHHDGVASVVATTNLAGSTLGTQRYDAWGIPGATSGSAQAFGFTGREPNASGLVYYRARFYDPELGRFTQRDPIGLVAGLNAYGYAGDSPINLNDPTGNCPACAGAVVGAVGGVVFQLGIDLFRGQLSSLSEYAGAIAGGAAGGAAAMTCGPACAGAAAGAASNLARSAVDQLTGAKDFTTIDGAVDGLVNLGIDTALGAATGVLADKLTPLMKEYVSTQTKGAIGESLTALRLLLTGQSYETQVRNGLGKSTYDFLVGNPELRNFIEAKFGTADLSTIQRKAAEMFGNNLTVDKWTYEKFWGMIASALASALAGEIDPSELGGGYTVGDVFNR